MANTLSSRPTPSGRIGHALQAKKRTTCCGVPRPECGETTRPDRPSCCSVEAVFGPLGRFVSLALLAVIVIGGLVFAGSGFMVMMPALLLVVPLVLGRYVGERRIRQLRNSLTSRRLRPSFRELPTGARTGDALLVRGGRLIAASIAVRPPPTVA